MKYEYALLNHLHENFTSKNKTETQLHTSRKQPVISNCLRYWWTVGMYLHSRVKTQ